MKVRFNRAEMSEALSVINSIVATRTPKPILQCVKVEALSDAVMLSATDLELGLRCAVTQVEVLQTGNTVVSADILSRIVREGTDELMAMELSKEQLHLRGASSHFQMKTQDVGEFPPVSFMEGEPDFRMELGQLRRLVEWTVFAAARESSRYAINGVLWEQQDGQLTLVGTDGRRLAMARGNTAWSRDEEHRSAVIPVKAVQLFTRLVGPSDASVSVQIHSNQALISTGPSTLSTALVEGQFPPYKDVIPQDNDRLVELPTAEFQRALKQAALLTSEESKAVRLSFSENKLVISSRAPEEGEATIELATRYQGEEMDIGFNPVFLLEVLRVTPTDEIRFALKESNRPGILELDKNFLHVVMPVSLSST